MDIIDREDVVAATGRLCRVFGLRPAKYAHERFELRKTTILRNRTQWGHPSANHQLGYGLRRKTTT
jgi:hypothetical protein